jgi:hypothetical protein
MWRTLVPERVASLKHLCRLESGAAVASRREYCVKAFVLVALLLAGIPDAFAQDAGSQANSAHKSASQAATEAGNKTADRPVKEGDAPPSHLKAQHKGPASAAALPAPLPTVVPEQFAPPQEAYASFPEASAAAPAKPSACQLRLGKIATFKALPILIGPGECGAVDAVLLDGVILPDRAKVVVSPPATLRCTMAEQVAAWLREDIAPAALKLGAPLRGLDNFDSYECRGRNRVRGATLSEHGRANALDVRAFKLANGEMIGLTDVNVAKDWRDGIRVTACARFSTVLGPGSDGHHEEHIHVDLAERRGGYKMCQWDVRDGAAIAEKKEPPVEAAASAADVLPDPVPLPRPRPLAANATRDVQLRTNRPRAQ